MASEIVISRRAGKNFESIHKYLLKEWGEKVAEDFTEIVFEFLKLLSAYPKIGSIEIKEKSIRAFVLLKQIKVFYRLKGEKIIILNFFDTRQHPSKKLK